jgi:hypothetical protein
MRSILCRSPGNGAAGPGRRRVTPWLASLALCLPVLALHASHFARPGATGFLFYDGLYYMANAREHFDAGFGLTYGNPCSPAPAPPRIYFHPHLIVLGTAWRVTGLAPGVVFAAAGLLAALVGVRLALALLAEHVPLDDGPGRALVVCFLWGGGLLSAAGWLRVLATGDRTPEAWLAFDPGGGWWFLNLGRNFV